MSNGKPLAAENSEELLAGHGRRTPPAQNKTLPHGWQRMPS